MPIVPKHIWPDVTDPVKYREPNALVGSGPYRLESYDLSTGTYLWTANEDYFMGPPYVKAHRGRPCLQRAAGPPAR